MTPMKPHSTLTGIHGVLIRLLLGLAGTTEIVGGALDDIHWLAGLTCIHHCQWTVHGLQSLRVAAGESADMLLTHVAGLPSTEMQSSSLEI
jgi:hypothetical protein